MLPPVWIGVLLSVFGYILNNGYLLYVLNGRMEGVAPLSINIQTHVSSNNLA